jgi:hypothetical protein
MPKRFTDTDIWRQSWFLDLSPESKLVWFYLVSKCYTAGIWKIDIPMMKMETGVRNISLQNFLTEVNRDYAPCTDEPVKRNRVMRIANGCKLWLTGFISFQYEKERSGVNPVIPVIKGALNRLRDENIYELAIKEGFVRIKGECESEPKNSKAGFNVYSSDIISSVNAVSSDLIPDFVLDPINNKIPAAADAGEAKGWQPFARDKDKDKDKDQDLQLFVLKDLNTEAEEEGSVHWEPPDVAEVVLERKWWMPDIIPDKADPLFILAWYKLRWQGWKLLPNNNSIFSWQKIELLTVNSRGSPFCSEFLCFWSFL